MGRETRTILLPYAAALVFTTLAVLLRWLLDRWLGDFVPCHTLRRRGAPSGLAATISAILIRQQPWGRECCLWLSPAGARSKTSGERSKPASTTT